MQLPSPELLDEICVRFILALPATELECVALAAQRPPAPSFPSAGGVTAPACPLLQVF
jgi:hypothetical protein